MVRLPWSRSREEQNVEPQSGGDADDGEREFEHHHPYYSRYYVPLKEIGNMRATPEFAAPTLVWHLGIWPLRAHDPQHVSQNGDRPILVDGVLITAAVKEHLDSIKPISKKERRKREKERRKREKERPNAEVADSNAERFDQDKFNAFAIEQFEKHTKEIDDHLNSFLRKLQDLGRARVDKRESFEHAEGVAERDRTYYNKYFSNLKRDVIGFTIWWADNGPIKGSKPGPDAVRIRVELTRRRDFLTLSFFIDASTLWKSTTPMAPGGRRRSEILRHLANVDGCCAPRVNDPVINGDRVPEKLNNANEAKALFDASMYLYDELWADFCKDFQLGSEADPQDLSAITGAAKNYRVFANFRGLVLATEGYRPAGQAAEPPGANSGHAGLRGYERFTNNDGSDASTPNEANAVIKAYWPFIRRITPAMDYRDVAAFSVMNWRCLVVTSLGSDRKDDPSDEGDGLNVDIPFNYTRMEKADEKDELVPVRHLFITKRQPHPRFIGRVVERMCALETIRLYAFKDWHVLQNASVHIRIRGQELDQIIHEWTMGRAYIDTHRTRETEAGKRSPQDINDDSDKWITSYTRYIEERLLKIGAALDRIGQSCVGGMHYRIGRSRYYVNEFHALLRTLRVGAIETWISYEQFADHGLNPAFTFISELGLRLTALRNRLQSVIDGIEASALVAQTSATRQNTMELRKITTTAKGITTAGLVSAFSVTSYYIYMLVRQIMVTLDSPDQTNVVSTIAWIAATVIGSIVVGILARIR